MPLKRVVVTLALYFTAVGLGVWISLSGFNKRLEAPVRAWDYEMAGETCHLQLLGKDMTLTLPGRIPDSARAIVGRASEGWPDLFLAGLPQEFSREAAAGGQYAVRQVEKCLIKVSTFFSEQYRALEKILDNAPLATLGRQLSGFFVR